MADRHFRLKVALKEFGQALFMPEENDRWAREKINNRIFEKLRRANLEHSINRTVIFGSAKKHTGLWLNMDYDCVIMVNVKKFPSDVNEVEALCDYILPRWQNALTGALAGIKVERKPQGLKFCYEGIEIDLLVGFNATLNPDDHGRSDRQVENVLQNVKRIHPITQRIEFARNVSTSLCEKGVDFIKTRSSVTNEVARIAKFWVQFAGPPEYKVSGKSTIIELICVEAVERAVNKEDILECFEKYLELMINHKYFRIGAEFLETLDPVEKEHMSKAPYIIDPSNPYNNMYCGPRVKKFLKEYEGRAAETLQKIHAHPSSAFEFDSQKRQAPRDNDWLDLVKILYVSGSAERHGVKQREEPLKFRIAKDLDKVQFNVLSVFSGDSSQYSNLMRFICCHAAFIPRNITVFEPYVECLQKALKVNNINVEIEKTVLVRSGGGSTPSVNFRYPVNWCEGIWIGI